MTTRRHTMTTRRHTMTTRRHTMTTRRHTMTTRRHGMTIRRHTMTTRRHKRLQGDQMNTRRHTMTTRRQDDKETWKDYKETQHGSPPPPPPAYICALNKKLVNLSLGLTINSERLNQVWGPGPGPGPGPGLHTSRAPWTHLYDESISRNCSLSLSLSRPVIFLLGGEFTDEPAAVGGLIPGRRVFHLRWAARCSGPPVGGSSVSLFFCLLADRLMHRESPPQHCSSLLPVTR